MDESYNKITVYLALAAGLVSFGFAPILVRLAPDTSPIVLVAYRTVAAALLLYPYWKVRGKAPPPGEKGSGREKVYIGLAGFCLGLHFTCWLSSLYYTSVASASVLITIHPILIILAERLLYKKNFAWTTWLGVIITFGGAALLGFSDTRASEHFSNPLLGNTLAFSGAVIFMIYLLIGQKVRQRRAWIDYVFPVYSYAAITCLLLVLITSHNVLNISTLGLVAGIGLAVGPQIIGHGSMNYAIKYISPTLLSTLILAEPLLASGFAILFFDEIPPLSSILAMIIILVGIGMTWKRAKTDG